MGVQEGLERSERGVSRPATADREYFIAMSSSYPLLEEVLADKTTFREEFDRLVAACDRTKFTISGGKLASTRQLISGIEDYVGTMNALSDGRESLALKENGTPEWLYGALNLTAYTTIALPPAVVVGVLLLPVLPFVGWIAAGTVGIGISRLVDRIVGPKRDEAVRGKREKLLAPVYARADSLDVSISTAFLREDLAAHPARFERTYRAMPPEEKETLAQRLLSEARDGALPMDSVGLQQYLQGLGSDLSPSDTFK